MKIPSLTLAGLLIATALHGAEPPVAKPAEPEMIHITSRDGFEYDLTSRSAAYKGAVVVTDPAMKLTCESLKVRFAAGTTNQTSQPMVAGNLGGRVELIEAEGKVIITNRDDGSTAVGDKAVYTAINETVVLSGGRPTIISSNGSGLRADQVIFDRRSGKFRAHGNIESFFSQELIGGSGLFNTTSRPPSLPGAR